jgi:UDP-N-acetylmuramoylalanine--D-glutamate ligase
MLTAAGKITYPIGNFGTGFSNYIRSSAAVVAELSSFQLTYLDPQLECAIITGIGEDHLNWHHSIREYRESKLKILNRAKKAVIDADCSAITNAIGSQKIFAAISQEKSFPELRRVINAENYMTYAENLILLNGEPFLDVSRAVRKEAYNLKNYMLAASAVLQNAERDAISYSVNKFAGLPHRCETVASIDGIRYINSSIDTSPERALTTLLSISGAKVPIFCGTGKGLSYKLLAKETACGSVGAALMGQVGEEMGKEIKRISPSFPLVYSQSMRDAVKSAATMLGGKGAVILAPAGVSYDKYKSFEERGDDFRSAVLEGQR